jgi:ketosteroid isomerase-like protein
METVQTFVRANESANLELIVATFDDTATVFFPSVQAHRATGKAEIREVFAELFRLRTGPITITPRDVNVQVLDEVAIVTAHLNALPTLPISEPVTFSRRTFVLRKVGERWLIVHLHASNYLISGTGR